MDIILTVSSEKRAELEQCAAANGTDLTSFILDAVEEKLAGCDGPSTDVPPYERWNADFRRWISSHQSRNPSFDDSRDSIYD